MIEELIGDGDEALCVIGTFRNQVDASLAEAILDANGIESSVMADNAAGWLNYLDTLHPIRLVVRERDAEIAVALLHNRPTTGRSPDEI